MKTRLTFVMLALLSAFNLPYSTAFAQGTAFTYQGRLNAAANPASGIYDLRFAIYDSPSSGAQQGVTLTNTATAVSNGLFTVTLDFGNQFPGANRWLEIGVRTNGGGAFATLNPRQKLTATPYAITAGNVTGVIPSGSLAGLYSASVTLNNPANVVAGAFSGNGSGLANVDAASLGGLTTANFWQFGGNNVAAGQFLGSTNNQALELKVGGVRALRMEPNFYGAPNMIGGSPNNLVDDGWIGATIAGGGATFDPNDGGSVTNRVSAHFGSIGGGAGNVISSGAPESVIAGGYRNVIEAYSGGAVIGGGDLNRIHAQARNATISGGRTNEIHTNALASVIAGGENNVISGFAYHAAIGGGAGNVISSGSGKSVIAGGDGNAIDTNSLAAVIGGGDQNRIYDQAPFATISGGRTNEIHANASESIIAGGEYNVISPNSDHAAIGGGEANHIGTNSPYSVIAGGVTNIINSFAGGAVVGGGAGNTIQSYNDYSTIGGGNLNTIQVSDGTGGYSTIAGGERNTILSAGFYGTIPGGRNNSATNYAFAAGRQAKALHTGTFVWADSQNADFTSTDINQFLIRAAAGVGINSANTAGAALAVNGGIKVFSGSTLEFGAGVAGKEPNAGKIGYQSFTAGFLDIVGAGTSTSDRKIKFYCEGGATFTGTISQPSDRNLKQDFQPLDGREVLAKVAALPIQSWAYKYDASKRHIGPVAQDFQAAFGLNGGDDKTIATIDADGVALAAIQGLNEKVEVRSQRSEARSQKLEQELEQKETEINELKQRLEKLERLVEKQVPVR